MRRRFGAASAAALSFLLLLPQPAEAGRRRGDGSTFQHEAVGKQTFASPQSDPIALSPTQDRLYVAHTTAGTVHVIDTATNQRIATIEVGIDPVSVAVRPDGNELWVANHVSDSVSVIDTDPASASLHQVVETLQEVVSHTDPTSPLVTEFDEPVGIAFASNTKAYVALSSRNRIAVVDATSYSVTGHIDVNAQEPRAIRVRDGLLYVLPFESGNQTELATCPKQAFTIDPSPGSQCTFDQADHNFAQNPQLVGAVVDLVVDPDVPDRDLYVYDTSDDSLVDVVSGIGTLLYGLAVSGSGDVFVSLTDARNHVNGQAGTSGQGLPDLENRIFLNQLGTVACGAGGCGAPAAIDLEEAPGAPVTTPLATPYGIAMSDDDATLVVTAGASSRIFTFDANATGMGGILGTLDVGAMPRGVALRSNPSTGAAEVAYVLNTLDNSVTVVDVSTPASPAEIGTISLPGDPTPEAVRLGRIAFNDANGSSSGTFACASCHPDGNTDQLLWIIGAQCLYDGCDQEELRSTMPVRGLRDTLPLHWDGVLGDPLGGTNGELETQLFGGGETAPANCGPNGGGLNCFRHLVDAGLAGVMCSQPSCATGPSGLAGRLTNAERDAMAAFLENVSYPPARSRRVDDVLTAQAVSGFQDFFFDQGGINLGPETCADAAGGCHALPFGTGTNSNFVGGFDAPTMRGITDRWMQFSAGITNVEEQQALSGPGNLIDPPFWTPAVGFDEFTNWKFAFGSAANPGAFRNVYNVGPFDIFRMIEEMSTGYPGAQGRQVTLNTRTTSGAALAQTEAILTALETADGDGLVNLRGIGLRNGFPIVYSFTASGLYETPGPNNDLTHAQLIAEAQAGTTLLTLTAALRANVGKPDFPPPALSVPSVGDSINDGRLALPMLPGDNPMWVRGLHVRAGAVILVDGVPASGTITCLNGGFVPDCPANVANPNGRNLEISLDAIPAAGVHFLQVQTPNGPLSNELPFTVE
ncbi:MAG: beta-propeller fold lactonase family protein [Deltaproteobacteria bacterium]|nr:MAG: beta-propeller fold lactonase family protein [Deltaproteobacteria bacterium]